MNSEDYQEEDIIEDEKNKEDNQYEEENKSDETDDKNSFNSKRTILICSGILLFIGLLLLFSSLFWWDFASKLIPFFFKSVIVSEVLLTILPISIFIFLCFITAIKWHRKEKKMNESERKISDYVLIKKYSIRFIFSIILTIIFFGIVRFVNISNHYFYQDDANYILSYSESEDKSSYVVNNIVISPYEKNINLPLAIDGKKVIYDKDIMKTTNYFIGLNNIKISFYIPEDYKELIEFDSEILVENKYVTSVSFPDNGINKINKGILKDNVTIEELVIPFIGENRNTTDNNNSIAYLYGEDLNQYYKLTSDSNNSFINNSIKKLEVRGGYICVNSFYGMDALEEITFVNKVEVLKNPFNNYYLKSLNKINIKSDSENKNIIVHDNLKLHDNLKNVSIKMNISDFEELYGLGMLDIINNNIEILDNDNEKHTVVFVLRDDKGVKYEKKQFNDGESLNKYSITSEVYGYDFKNWKYKDRVIDLKLEKVVSDMVLIAEYSPKKYDITVKSNYNDYEMITGIGKAEYESNATLSLDATKAPDGYVFAGWFDSEDSLNPYTDKDGKIITSITFKVDGDMNYYAKWVEMPIIINQNIEKNYKLTGEFVLGYTIKLTFNKYQGYTLFSLKNGENTIVCSGMEYDINIPNDIENIDTYTIEWISNPFSVTSSNDNYGTASYDGDCYISGKIKLKAEEKTGYSFVGWYKNSEVDPISTLYEYEVTITKDSTNYLAKFEKYTMTINVGIGGYLSSTDEMFENNVLLCNSNSSKEINVTKGKTLTLKANPNSQYQFDGWYVDSVYKSINQSFDFTMSDKDVNIELKFIIKKNQVSVINEASSITITGEGYYSTGDAVKLTASNVSSTNSMAWYLDNELKAIGNEYSFTMANKDVEVKAVLKNYYRESLTSKQISFGSYPQTKVTDSTKISSLNSKAGTKPTSSNTYNWTKYEYYKTESLFEKMFYIDIDDDNNGTFDYRGVYMVESRPTNTASGTTTNQVTNGYNTSTVYWFKYEPIVWNILSENDGIALIASNKLLDSQDFWGDPTNSYSSLDDLNSKIINSYCLSNIRNWLNDTFYDMALSNSQKDIIVSSSISNNAPESIDVSIKSALYFDVIDNIYLMSEAEVKKYYTSVTDKKAIATDYAKCQGVIVNSTYSSWLLRDSIENDKSNICSYGGVITTSLTTSTQNGIRPVCTIML
ncbi:MAG: InlB B-repeat-containing protein [Acholeplasmatales bacterium]|nr:InlB B-repeat-containing protein [Acholeplasmatales bacterium]